MAPAETQSRVPSLAPLLSAKARVPLLPTAHVPRPRLVAALDRAVASCRLVELSAGGLTGKTTILVEFLHAHQDRRVVWYAVDELDTTMRAMLEGLALAALGSVPPGDELHVLAAIVEDLGADGKPTLLVLDDTHLSPVAHAVRDRLLRYLDPRVRLICSGRPVEAPPTAPRCWLEDQGQIHTFATRDLRLDAEEQARFATVTGRPGADWAVSYRAGGEQAVVARLAGGVLPELAPGLRALVDLLAVVPAAAPTTLAAALGLTTGEAQRRLHILEQDTILLERVEGDLVRLVETARMGALALLDSEQIAAARHALAQALAVSDPCEAARLFSLAGDFDRAVAAGRHAGLVAWQRHEAAARAIEAMLPRAVFARITPLALATANRRLVAEGARAVHALVRATHPDTPDECVDRFRVLGLCAQARGRRWSLRRTIAGVAAIAEGTERALTLPTRAYAFAVWGTLLLHLGENQHAHDTLFNGLSLLELCEAHDPLAQGVRLQTYHTLALAQARLGAFDLAEQSYARAATLAEEAGKIGPALEIANNRAMLLQYRGRHQESAVLLREAVANRWAAPLGLRPPLLASLAEALAALGERAEAIRTFRAALAEMATDDTHGVAGLVHAELAVLLAEAGQSTAARAVLAGVPADGAPALLARALLQEAAGQDGMPCLDAAAAAATNPPLQAQIQAHRARLLAATDGRAARRLANAMVRESAYPLTTREARILGSLVRRAPRRTKRTRAGARRHTVPGRTAPRGLSLRFFGGPEVLLNGEPLGHAGWRYAETRDLFWYALAHGTRGYTREEACADLFPELDGLQAARSLRNVTYALRQLMREWLGVQTLLKGRSGRLRLLPQDLSPIYTSDLEQLSTCIERLRDGEGVSAADLLALLGHPFLAGLRGDWLRPFRTVWEGTALRALDMAATAAERAGAAEDALLLLRREVEFCPDDPALTRRLMLVASTMADEGALRAAYLDHCRTMRDELGLAPDTEVVALYSSLSHS